MDMGKECAGRRADGQELELELEEEEEEEGRGERQRHTKTGREYELIVERVMILSTSQKDLEP